ncbi:MAG: T9SS type A sorting domain-containing protein [Bacteroidetes bacterium]|nr:T9SS type A sorting domain-containing protein [Bacteroidota bacterium]
MKKIPSFVFVILTVILSSLWNESLGQPFYTCNCPAGALSKILQPGEVKNISSFFPGTNLADGYCFLMNENSQLNIDKDFFFDGCYIVQKDNAKILVNEDKQAWFRSGTVLEDCSGFYPGSNGIELETNARLYGPALTVAGNGIMEIAIKANTDSRVDLSSPDAQTQIYNIGGFTAIDCANCKTVRTSNISIFGVNWGIHSKGRPNLYVENTYFQAAFFGISNEYSSSGPAPTLYIANSIFDIGNGIEPGGAGIYLNNQGVPFALSATTGVPIIQNCVVNMTYTGIGIEMVGLMGVTLNSNEAKIMGGNTSAATRLYDIGSSSDLIFTGNKATGNVLTPTSSTTGMVFSNSPNCVIANNIVEDVSYGIRIKGNCSTPNSFSHNQFNGSQQIGLSLETPQGGVTSTIGDQYCTANKWNGTFSNFGAQNLSAVNGNQFFVKGTTPPNMPTNNAFGWFIDNELCPEFGGGDETGSRSNEGATDAATVYPKISVHPNPASSSFEVRLPENEGNEYMVELTDLAGKLVILTKAPHGAENISIETDALSPGIYLVRVSSDKVRHVEKIIITR